MLNRINPTVPTTANKMLSQLNVFSMTVVFLASRPLCRNQRADRNARSRKMVVTHEPAMKRGFRLPAPTSEMYAIVCAGFMDAY